MMKYRVSVICLMVVCLGSAIGCGGSSGGGAIPAPRPAESPAAKNTNPDGGANAATENDAGAQSSALE
ncbi:MAG: hypothetical protein MUF23_00530 [Pirellula sp.]|jgi:hypothetical protein|nr:hypothetical protein [Pirellula sp.]